MPPFGLKRGAGGGRGVAVGAQIPFVPRTVKIPSGNTTIDKTKFGTLTEELFGQEEDRRNNADCGVVGLDMVSNYGKSSLENNHPFGAIEDVTIDTTTMNSLRGWLYNPSPSLVSQNPTHYPYVVLFLSGSGGSAERYSRAVAAFYATKGLRTLAVNYRGFGKSGNKFRKGANRGGTPTESGLYDDAYYMYLYLTQTRGILDQRIIVHGFSLGGAVAANLVKTLIDKKKGLRGLVLQSPIVTAPKAAADNNDLSAVEQKIASGLTRFFMGGFNTLSYLRFIARKRPNLRLCLTSGMHSAQDQLDISAPLYGSSKTFLQHVQTMGFTQVNHARAASAGHTDCKEHMLAADSSGNIQIMWT